MRKKLYILTLALLLVIPLVAFYLISDLSPQKTDFPSTIKILFLLCGLFLVLLNQAIDYLKDNRPVVRFLFTFFSFLPLISFSFFSTSSLIIETPLFVWIGLTVGVYGILINHTGVFSQNNTRTIEKIATVVLTISLFLSFYALNTTTTTAFTLWLWSIYGSLVVSIAVLFNKKSASEI